MCRCNGIHKSSRTFTSDTLRRPLLAWLSNSSSSRFSRSPMLCVKSLQKRHLQWPCSYNSICWSDSRSRTTAASLDCCLTNNPSRAWARPNQRLSGSSCSRTRKSNWTSVSTRGIYVLFQGRSGNLRRHGLKTTRPSPPPERPLDCVHFVPIAKPPPQIFAIMQYNTVPAGRSTLSSST